MDDEPVIEIKRRKRGPNKPKPVEPKEPVKKVKVGCILAIKGKYRAKVACFDGVRYYPKGFVIETNSGDEIPEYFVKL